MTLSELFAKLAARSALEEDKAGMCAGQKAAENTEDFPSCHICVGKATAAVLLGSDGTARLGTWRGLLDTGCLVILQAGLGSLDLQLSLFFLHRLASPRCWFLWQQNCSGLQAEVTPSVQSSFHTPSTDHAPRETQSLQSRTNEQFTCQLSAATPGSEQLCHVVEV